MNPKSLLIPVAAFAVTVTGVSAFSSDVLEQAGLTEEQIAAFEEARELREEGDRAGARDVLESAGIDLATMESLRETMRGERGAMHNAIHDAVENEDFAAFQEAVADSPLADIVTSEADFQLFVEAHNLKENGDIEEAKAIFDELGLEGFGHGRGGHHGPRFGGDVENAPFWDELSAEQQESLKEAHEAQDFDTIKEILDEAGIERPERGEGHGRFGHSDE